MTPPTLFDVPSSGQLSPTTNERLTSHPDSEEAQQADDARDKMFAYKNKYWTKIDHKKIDMVAVKI